MANYNILQFLCMKSQGEAVAKILSIFRNLCAVLTYLEVYLVFLRRIKSQMCSMCEDHTHTLAIYNVY